MTQKAFWPRLREWSFRMAALFAEVAISIPGVFIVFDNGLALYRTAQEALTNIQKHAHADQVWLQVEQIEAIVSLRVSDNGVGLSERGPESGFGLRGIQERATQLGGEMRLEPRPGGGTQVSLWLPLVDPR